MGGNIKSPQKLYMMEGRTQHEKQNFIVFEFHNCNNKNVLRYEKYANFLHRHYFTSCHGLFILISSQVANSVTVKQME